MAAQRPEKGMMKMKKMIRWIAGIGCLVFVILVGGSKLPVRAAENQKEQNIEMEGKVPPYILDVQKECVLEIQTDVTQKTEGAMLTIYQVGKIDATSLSLSFILNEAFEGSKAELMNEGNTERRQAIETLCSYASDNHIKPFQTVQLDGTGGVRLTVPQGAYLICQLEEGETQIQSSLVGVPCVGESLNEWQYHMVVQLKAGLISVPTGDMQNGILYTGLILAAVLLLFILILARKRRCGK